MRLQSVSETSPRNKRRKRNDCGKLEQTTTHLKMFSRPVMIRRWPEACPLARNIVPKLTKHWSEYQGLKPMVDYLQAHLPKDGAGASAPVPCPE